MIYKNLIPVIEKNLDTLALMWYEELRKSEHMEQYKSLDEESILQRGRAVYSNLVKWLDAGASSDDTEDYFEGVGAKRLKESFSLTEVNYAIYLIKKVLLDFIPSNDEYFNNLDSSEAIKLMRSLSDYFDLGIFFITRGYLHELISRLEESKKFTQEELKSIFKESSFDKEDLDSEEFIWRHV